MKKPYSFTPSEGRFSIVDHLLHKLFAQERLSAIVLYLGYVYVRASTDHRLHFATELLEPGK